MDEVKINRITARLSNNYLELRLFPDTILRNYSKPIHTFDKTLERFADQMYAFMKAHRGIGLAAPQVGVLFRIITIHVEGVEKFLVNPEILSSSPDSYSDQEGCLSIPGKWFDVNRFYKVEVCARSPEGKKIHFEAEGLIARILQHEIDHLNGILICDKGLEVYKGRNE